jgi:hypothetical protein
MLGIVRRPFCGLGWRSPDTPWDAPVVGCCQTEAIYGVWREG